MTNTSIWASSPPGPTSPAGTLAAANALIAGVDDELWAARTPEQLIAANEQIEKIRSHLAALQAHIVTEVQARGIAKSELAWSSTGDWFTHTAGTHRRRADAHRGKSDADGDRRACRLHCSC